MVDASGPVGSDAAPMRDAAPDGVSRGPITVTVYGDGVDRSVYMPVPGADVYFVEPDGTTTTVVTGTDGVAIAEEPNNTTVWVVHHDSSFSSSIETYEGLLIGDSLIDGNPAPEPADTLMGYAYVAFPSFSDATHYELNLSCASSPTPGSASPIAPGFVACPQEMAANAIVWATDSAGNLGYTSASGVDLTAHTSAGTALVLPAFQPGAMIGVTFTNLPSSMGESEADLYARYTRGADPVPVQNVTLRETTLTDTMTSSVAIAPVGDQTRVLGSVYIGANAYAFNYDVTLAGVQSSVTVDASTMVHPAKLWQYDAAAHAITWFQESIGVDPTVVESGLSWNGSVQVFWHVTAPYAGGPALTLPAFPSALASSMMPPDQASYRQVTLTSYAGKTYHDALVGHAAGAASWRTGVAP